MNIDRALISKYNKPVPRYTSYPPANFFSDSYSNADYLMDLEASNELLPENISIYIHIPFCKKLCFYCGCNSCPMAKEDEVAAYIKALKEEIKIVTRRLDKSRKISQIHYGGGTPNSIPVHYLQEINNLFFNTFSLIDKPEIAIECHPAYLDKEYIEGLKQAGFNRFSLGIQDFNADVLKAVNREPSVIPIDRLIHMLRLKSNVAINLDFIYGLSLQTKNSFLDTISKAITLKPDRLVTFSYAHVPWVNKAQLALEKKGLPTGEQKIDMTEGAYNLLEISGYKPVGMDHYVSGNDELYTAMKSGKLHRNFQGYCTKETTGQVYAFGVSGISQLNNAYSQNTKSIEEYIKSIKAGILPIVKGHKINDNEGIIRNVITKFMCDKSISLTSIANEHNINTNELSNIITIDEPMLNIFQNDGIIYFDGDCIQIKENGLPFIRNVAASFDPLLKDSNKTFSKSV